MDIFRMSNSGDLWQSGGSSGPYTGMFRVMDGLSNQLLGRKMEPNDFLARLDRANNEEEVRQKLAGGQYGERHKALAQEWLRRREDARNAEAAARAEAREDESLAIAREALGVSRRSHRLAVAALIVSTISALIAAGITAYVQYISTAP